MHLFLSINRWMQITSQKLEMGKIFIVLQYSRLLLKNKTNGRSNMFFWQTSYHSPMFLLLDMEEYVESFQVQLKTKNNMKL